MKWFIGSVVALASGALMAFLFLAVEVGPAEQSLSARSLAGVIILGVFMGVIVVAEEWGATPGAGKFVRVAAGAAACAASAFLFELPWSGMWLAGLAGALLGYLGMKWVEHI